MNKSVYAVWKHSEPMGNVTLSGYSESALCSCFYIKEKKFCLDAGIPLCNEPHFLFVTHGHSDHAGQFATILTGNTKPVHVFVSVGTRQQYVNFLVAKQRLTKNNPLLTEEEVLQNRCMINELANNQIVDLDCVGEKMRVVGFETYHKVPSIGFAFFYIRSRLKPEYKSLSGAELKKLRDNKILMNETYYAPAFCYVGDSSQNWLEHPIFKEHRFPHIICECTFVGALEKSLDEARERAKEHGHTCWEDLAPVIAAYNDASEIKTEFILTHWSNRYLADGSALIKKHFKDVENVRVWTGD